MDENATKEIMEKAIADMVGSLNRFGPSETLGLLITFSNIDPVLAELLSRFPSLVATGDFLFDRPTFEVSQKEFLIDRNSSIPIWKNRENHGIPQTISKRKRTPQKKRTKKSNCVSAKTLNA